MNTITTHTHEMRVSYLAAIPHTLFTALVWICSGLVAQILSKETAILTFIIGGSFVFPGGELLKKLFRAPNIISRENKLPLFFTLLAFTVPLSYPLIYLICKTNINQFYPSFMILVGAHYLPFVYGYGMRTFAALSILLVGLGTWICLSPSFSFSIPAIVTGTIMIAFAIIHYFIIKKDVYEHT
jgi:hypothetical protein